MAEAPTEVWSYPTQSVSESFRFAFGIGLPGRIAEFIKAERGPQVECGSRIRSLLGRLDCIGGYWWILIWTKSLRYYYDVPQDNSGEQQGALVYNARSQAWMLLLQIQRG
jgi:hypothetical protein